MIAVTSLIFGLLSVPGNQVITTHVTQSVVEGRTEDATRTLRFLLMVSQAMSLFAYVVLAIATLALGGLLGVAEEYKSALLLYGFVGVALGTLQENLAVLRLTDRVHLGLVAQVTGTMTRISILVLALQAGSSLLTVVVAYVIGDIMTGVGTLLAAVVSARRMGLPGLLSSLSVKVPGRNVMSFQAGLFAQASIVTAISRIDVLVLANLISAADVGLYRVGIQIVEATKLPFTSISSGVQAEYSRQWYGGDGAAIRRISFRFTLLSLGLAAVGYGLLILVHEQIIRILLGQEFVEAARPLLILLPGALASASVAALYVLPAATGRIMPLLVSTSLTLIAMVAALLALAPHYGAEGAAWAYSIAWLAFTAAMIPFAVNVLRRTHRVEGQVH